MKSRNAIVSLSTFILTLFLTGTKADAMAVNFCIEPTVMFGQLAAALNNGYQCSRVPCNGVARDFETKRIANDGGVVDIKQWLLTTYDLSVSYAPAQQIPIIAQAVTLANDNRPASKFVFNIQFFSEQIVATGPFESDIGATITYARCIRRNLGTGSSPLG